MDEDLDALGDIYHPEDVDHCGDTTFEGTGKVNEAEAKYCRAFPDYTMEIKPVIEDVDHVAYYWEIQGTHESGFNGIPPTDKKITYQGWPCTGLRVTGWSNRGG